MKGLAGLLLLPMAVWAQQTLAPPQVGFLVNSNGGVYPVNGLAGNFVLGRATGSGIISAAFSGAFRLLKTDSALSVVNQLGRVVARTDAPPGPALFAFSSDGSPTVVYFPQSKTLRVWDGREFRPGPEFDQDVICTSALNTGQAAFVVQRDGELWNLRVDLESGAIVSQAVLPGIAAPVLMLAGGGLVYRDSKGLAIRQADGSEKHIAAHLPANIAFGQMGGAWVQITDLATGRLSALNAQPGHEGYYLLPEVRP
jgi:hypothetical protein